MIVAYPQGPTIAFDTKSRPPAALPPPPPMNTTMGGGAQESVIDDDDMSDIVSISGESTGGEVKEVNVSGSTKPKRTRRKKKTEINL